MELSRMLVFMRESLGEKHLFLTVSDVFNWMLRFISSVHIKTDFCSMLILQKVLLGDTFKTIVIFDPPPPPRKTNKQNTKTKPQSFNFECKLTQVLPTGGPSLERDQCLTLWVNRNTWACLGARPAISECNCHFQPFQTVISYLIAHPNLVDAFVHVINYDLFKISL